LLVKLDISKAFDFVSWEYLLELLQHRGFSAQLAESIACNILIFSPIERGQQSMAQALKRAQARTPVVALPLYPSN
jgi:hypothetical protein